MIKIETLMFPQWIELVAHQCAASPQDRGLGETAECDR